MSTLTVDDLEPGDTLTDTEGHEGRWSRILIEHVGDEVHLAPAPNGTPIKIKRTTIPSDDVQARLDSGRYEAEDVSMCKTLDADALPATDDVYIRFGDIPDGERSHDHTNDRQEAGVSVYAATVEASADHAGVYHPTGQKLQQVLLLAHRDTYLVTGEEVGRGEDGEPLLRDVEVVCELASPKGVGGFVPAEDA
jgi:hypothetical protein